MKTVGLYTGLLCMAFLKFVIQFIVEKINETEKLLGLFCSHHLECEIVG